jgi:cytoskeletal protein CcmA (bactofilin family)
MFGKKKGNATPLVLHQEKFDTLIGRHAEFEGNFRLNESIRIDGRVIGDVKSASDRSVSVVIGPTGEVVGDLVAHRVIVAGKVSGNIHALERVELHSECFVEGDIKYVSMAIEHGARVQGLMLHLGDPEGAGRNDKDAQDAIRRAQVQSTSSSGNAG